MTNSKAECAECLQAVVILKNCAEGQIDLSCDDPVHIAIVHDGSGFNPGGAIVVIQGGHDTDTALDAAYELLEAHILADSARMKDAEKDAIDMFRKDHGLSAADFREIIASEYPSEHDTLRDEYWNLVNTLTTESVTGCTWTLSAADAADVVRNSDGRVKENIKISE
jgi:hypothetical protein